MKKRVRTLSDRFWPKVNVTSGCWLWGGGDNGRYGVLSLHNRIGLSSAHRISYLLAHGPIPDDKEVCHTCDTPLCVRPDHLFLGTRLDNMRDCLAKGRMAHGDRCGAARLTAGQVREIRVRRPRGTRQHRALAVEFGVNIRTIYRIVSGETWVRELSSNSSSEWGQDMARRDKLSHTNRTNQPNAQTTNYSESVNDSAGFFDINKCRSAPHIEQKSWKSSSKSSSAARPGATTTTPEHATPLTADMAGICTRTGRKSHRSQEANAANASGCAGTRDGCGLTYLVGTSEGAVTQQQAVQ